MIITKSIPFTHEEIEQLKEQFDVYIKTVIDIEERVCSAGMDRHFEGEQILLTQGSRQSDIWGGSVDVNIRPSDNNTKNDILSEEIREKYKKLTEFFFKIVL